MDTLCSYPMGGMGGISFAGHPKDGPAQDYVDYCNAMAALARVPEHVETLARVHFTHGLRGRAATWYEDLDHDERRWDVLSARFVEKFSNPDPYMEVATRREVFCFAREKGESLTAYIQRAENLASKVKTDTRQILLTNFVTHLADGETDARLQERVSDRLFASDKWTQGMAAKNLTMADLKIILYDCRSSASEKIARQYGESIPAVSLDPIRALMDHQVKRDEQWAEQQAKRDEKMYELIKQLEAFRVAQNGSESTRPYGQYGRSGYNNQNTDRQMGGNYTNSYNNNNNNPRKEVPSLPAPGTSGPKNDMQRDPDFFWCFSCGEWGHMGYSCRNRDKCSPEKFEERREQWQQNSLQMKRDRRRELDTRMQSNYIGDMGWNQQDAIPPPGYALKKQSTQPPLQTCTMDFQNYRPPRVEEMDNMMESMDSVNAATRNKGKARETPDPRGPSGKVTKPSQRPGVHFDGQTRERVEELLDSGTLEEQSGTDVVRSQPSQQMPPVPEMTSEEFERLRPMMRSHLERMGDRPHGTLPDPLVGPAPLVPHSEEVQMKEAPPPTKTPAKRRLELEKIRATEEYQVPAFDLGKQMRDTRLSISVLQLLQLAPILRQQMTHLMQCRKRLKSDAAKAVVNSLIAPFQDIMGPEQPTGAPAVLGYTNLVAYNDVAKPDGQVASTLGYVVAYLEGYQSGSVLVDGGSSVELISHRFVTKHKIPSVQLRGSKPIRMANDTEHYITACTYINTVVGGILALVKFYIMDAQQDWEVLLGKTWLRRMCAVEYHGEEKLTITGAGGQTQTIPLYPCPDMFVQTHSEQLPMRTEPDETVEFVEDDREIIEEVEEILKGLNGSQTGDYLRELMVVDDDCESANGGNETNTNRSRPDTRQNLPEQHVNQYSVDELRDHYDRTAKTGRSRSTGETRLKDVKKSRPTDETNSRAVPWDVNTYRLSPNNYQTGMKLPLPYLHAQPVKRVNMVWNITWDQVTRRMAAWDRRSQNSNSCHCLNEITNHQWLEQRDGCDRQIGWCKGNKHNEHHDRDDGHDRQIGWCENNGHYEHHDRDDGCNDDCQTDRIETLAGGKDDDTDEEDSEELALNLLDILKGGINMKEPDELWEDTSRQTDQQICMGKQEIKGSPLTNRISHTNRTLVLPGNGDGHGTAHLESMGTRRTDGHHTDNLGQGGRSICMGISAFKADPWENENPHTKSNFSNSTEGTRSGGNYLMGFHGVMDHTVCADTSGHDGDEGFRPHLGIESGALCDETGSTIASWRSHLWEELRHGIPLEDCCGVAVDDHDDGKRGRNHGGAVGPRRKSGEWVDAHGRGPTPLCMGKSEIKAYPLRFRNLHTNRPLTGQRHEAIVSWFENSRITLGDLAGDDNQRHMIMRLCYTFKDCFVTGLEDIRTTDLLQHHIPLIPGALPGKRKQYRYSGLHREFARKVFPAMEKAGIIQRGDSAWVAPTLFVDKPGSKELRVVHDYRDINSKTIKAGYPCHNMEADLNSVHCGRSSIFSQADASNGFWAIQIAPMDKHKTAFTGPNGMYYYNNMPQGLTGSPATYARFGDTAFGHLFFQDGTEMESILGYMEDIHTSFSIYVDDHHVGSENWEDHFNFLWKRYFPRVAWAPIGLSGRKTKLFSSSVDCVGYSLEDGKIRPARKHRERFALLAEHFRQNPPKSWNEILVLIYLTPFLRKFIPGRADLVSTIKKVFFHGMSKTTRLGRESIQCQEVPRDDPTWTPEAQAALLKICDSIQTNATFGARPGTQFHMATDASDTGTGGVLFQLEDTEPGTPVTDANFSKTRIIMWMSHKLTDSEKRYTMPEKEMFAIVVGLKETQWLVGGSPFALKVYTDHKGIIDSMANLGEVHGKVARWIDILQESNVEYIHRANTTKIMKIADGMSRMPDNLKSDPPWVKRRMGVEVVPATTEHPVQVSMNVADTDNGEWILPEGSPQDEDKTQELTDKLEKWFKSQWYGEVLTAMVYGHQAIPTERRKLIRRRSLRYRVFRQTLYYLEQDESLAECVMTEEVPMKMQKAHDASGHFGPEITMQKLRGRFFWPDRTRDVEAYCLSCLVCQQTGRRLPRADPKTITILEPWALVAMDYLGPITPIAQNGDMYVLVVVDYMTRFVMAQSHREATGSVVTETWDKCWGSIMGWPRKIYCDNGSHFKNLNFEAMTQKHGTKITFGPISHPSTTGLAERNVRLIKNQLMKWATERNGVSLEAWNQALPTVVVNLNNRHMSTVGTSPAMAMLGFEPYSRHENMEDEVVESFQDGTNCVEELERETNLMRIDSREEGRERVRTRKTEAMNDNNLRKIPRSFRVGDVVWEKLDKENKLKGKFQRTWGNLSTIVRVVSSVSYEVESMGGGATRKVHVDDLKQYIPRQERLKPPRLNYWDVADWDLTQLEADNALHDHVRDQPAGHDMTCEGVTGGKVGNGGESRRRSNYYMNGTGARAQRHVEPESTPKHPPFQLSKQSIHFVVKTLALAKMKYAQLAFATLSGFALAQRVLPDSEPTTRQEISRTFFGHNIVRCRSENGGVSCDAERVPRTDELLKFCQSNGGCKNCQASTDGFTGDVTIRCQYTSRKDFGPLVDSKIKEKCPTNKLDECNSFKERCMRHYGRGPRFEESNAESVASCVRRLVQAGQ
ncbi:Ribonuclease H-like protein [Metarhizium album ARSEF 1941]|uniref:RNA-directed DNA polymerase n=1 Tax=Metarhizium album (strain ARSEF 1941) TaxID=1081103 RepID=A0A0B2WS61_METAS|nr:Ribonuclease H-like protein [Metarhizium album ARSEF 1941]KHN95785.1 Ribonuclease H-like protein [Metarhizium album ARSEF 1941]